MRKTRPPVVIPLSDRALDLVAGRFRLLSDPTRLKILNKLGRNEMTVTEIVAKTGSGQANVSKHLGAMLEAGVVARRKSGLNAHYSVADASIFALCDVVCSRLMEEVKTRRAVLKRS